MMFGLISVVLILVGSVVFSALGVFIDNVSDKIISMMDTAR